MIRSFFKVKRKKFAGVSWVCETFVFQSEKKKILAGVSRVGGSRDCDTFIFSKKYFAGRGVAGWRAQASKVLCSFIELAKRARLSARERKGMTKLMLKLENTYFFEKHVRLGARSHSKPPLH